MNAALFARVDALMRATAPSSASRPSRSACSPSTTACSSAPAPGSPAPTATRLKAGAASGSRASAPPSARTCSPTSRPGAAARRRTTSRACPPTSSPPRRQAAAERGADGPRRHPVAQPDRALPAVLAPPRPARAGVPRLGRARRERRRPPTTAPIVAETLALREERARLLGYPDFAAYKLEPEMAKTPEAVRDLLMAVWAPARAQAEADAERARGADARRRRQRRARALGLALLRRDPPGARARLRRGGAEALPRARRACSTAAFDVAGRLFGLSFHPIEAELYHPDARAWEVRRATGTWASSSATTSPAPRSGPAPGARPSAARASSTARCARSSLNVCNFAKAPDGEPSLLTFDDARTLFHEMGHALHVLLSDVTYEFVSGTSRRARLRRAAEPALRALAGDPRGARGARPPRRDRRADAARADGPADRRAQLRPGLRHGRVPRLGAGRPRLPRRPGAGRPDGGAGRDARRGSGCRARS